MEGAGEGKGVGKKVQGTYNKSISFALMRTAAPRSGFMG
jgi:hypothetical protein